MATSPGTRIGPYEVLAPLGAGGMGEVWRARDSRLGRDVAIKTLPAELAREPELLGRLKREARILASLRHPGITTIFGLEEIEGQSYLVLECVEGPTLAERLEKGPLPLEEALEVCRQIAEAMEAAHESGVIHRDLKPSNVKLVPGGEVKVLDFGIGKAAVPPGLAKDASLSRTLTVEATGPGAIVGTAPYMSPEQALGQAVDRRTDIWSFGCVLFECLSGSQTFGGQGFAATVARVLEREPDWSVLPEGTPTRVRALLRQCLVKDPRKRLRDMGDARLELERVISGANGAAGDVGAPADMLADLPERSVRHPGVLGNRKRLSTWIVLVGAGLIALALGWAAWRLWLHEHGGTTSSAADRSSLEAQQPKMIAVLPFENLGPPTDEYFAAGITDEITARLGAVTGLRVLSRRAAQRYADTGKSVRDIGREQGIDHVLVGSVRWAGTGRDSNRVRITLELLRTRDEVQLWSTTYDRVIDDIFEVQSDIAGQVAERLGVTLLVDERDRLRAKPTENQKAYTLYLKGRYFWNKRTPADAQTALDYFQQAVDLDPGYSLAWVGIADTWISRGWYSRLAPRDAFPKAKSALMRALEFDSTLAEAHASLAHVHLEFDHDWTAAEREYLRAIELDPKYATAHQWYGGFLSAMGRHAEALRQAEIAQALDPLSPIIQTWVGLRYYFARKPEAAIAEIRKALELDPNFAPAHWHLSWAYEQMDRFDEGVAEAQRTLALDPGNLLYLASLAHAYARAGRQNEARAILARLKQASTTRHVSAYHVAVVYIALGDITTGLDWLERAYDEQSPWIGYMGVDPRVDPVRSHPRFKILLRRAHLDKLPELRAAT
jgi:eukaryotic-like serine/threonine-protein kinase